ncbi:hypothetical protein [Mycobacterium sp. BK086]|uniref:hypothetical protein n=1 Tax=Mycobacterium sp. BK086 TaxID=2512165 RepID=UPI001061068B|nr:hypothetical protein [Mycobacterium sp. BK086]
MGLAALTVIAAGCSSNDSSSESTSSATTTTSAAATSSMAAGALDDSTCLDIGFAKDNLMVATSADKARTNADTLEKYSPPDPVKAAIEHFVTTVGAQPNDADLDANRNAITDWLKQICPNLK